MDRRRPNPLRGFMDMSSEMNRMRHLGLYGHESASENLGRTHSSAWVPTADVSARGADLIIRIELAGVRREEVEITFDDGELTVSGQRLTDADDEEEFYVQERYQGVFRRTMTLPAGIDEDDITADYTDGLLDITVANGASAPRPRRISIG